MLGAVGNPVAVNPNRELRKLAEKRGWQIRDFRRAVPLRRRLPHVPRPGGKLAAVAAAAVIAAVFGWVYLRHRRARRPAA